LDCLKEKPNSIFAADTNIVNENELEKFTQNNYTDVWNQLLPNQQGFTLVEHPLR
jgi:hypothetical protein